jgi:hypothetical protein
MSSLEVRPRFTQILKGDPESVRTRLAGALDPARCECKSFPGYLSLFVPEAERHLGSPRLTLSLEAEGEAHTRVEGVYGPNANLWSAFLYAWLLVGSAGVFSGILGACQARLGMRPWGLWIFALMATAGLGLYLLARLGRRLGEAQMRQLHQLYEAATGVPVSLE